MSHDLERDAEKWLQRELARQRCDWCRNPNKNLYRLNMCRSCYGIRRELKRLHKLVMSTDAAYGKNWPTRSNRFIALEFNYNVAIEMAESAQILGKMYERLLQHADSLECEHTFRELSGRFVGKDLFNHSAFLFDHFSPVHRRYLMYLIGKMMQEYYSRNRRKMAYARVMEKTRTEVLRQRAWGTYRVETDVKRPLRQYR
jgi:hypothetical protein